MERDAYLWPEGSARLPLAKVARAAGMPEATVRRARRLLGFADPGDEDVCRPAEIELFRALAGGIALFGEEAPLQFVRVMGASAAVVAEAAAAMFGLAIGDRLREAGATDAEYEARRIEATIAFGEARAAFDIALRMHFERAGEHLGLALHRPGPEDLEFAVAFVDLVASTEFAVGHDVRAYAAAVRDFEACANEAAVRNGVRLVKLMGDAAMFAGRKPAAVVAAAQELIGVVSADTSFSGARGGVAYGAVVARDGDYFGPAVNLAARLAAHAPPRTLFADAAIAQRVPDIADDVGTRPLKGFDEPLHVYALRGSRAT